MSQRPDKDVASLSENDPCETNESLIRKEKTLYLLRSEMVKCKLPPPEGLMKKYLQKSSQKFRSKQKSGDKKS